MANPVYTSGVITPWERLSKTYSFDTKIQETAHWNEDKPYLAKAGFSVLNVKELKV